MKLVLSLVWVLTGVVCAQEEAKSLVLVSVCLTDNVTRFILLSERQYTAITSKPPYRDRGDFPNSGYLLSAAALKRAIERVPQGSVIQWRGWKPAGTCLPRKDIVDDIKAFSASRGVELRIPEDGAD
jgi:hypothetical protein